MVVKDLWSPTKQDSEMDCSEKSFATIQPFWIVRNNHPNTKTDTEFDENQKRFFTHFEGSIQSY